MRNNQSPTRLCGRSHLYIASCISLAGLLWVSGGTTDTSSWQRISHKNSAAIAASTRREPIGAAASTRFAGPLGVTEKPNERSVRPVAAADNLESRIAKAASRSTAHERGGGSKSVKPMTAGATIFVTTTLQKIGGPGTGGCSLQEAIYSANFHNNIAIDSTEQVDHFVTTDCVAGTGNDTIVLPVGAVFLMDHSLDDEKHNFLGPTAAPLVFSNITIEANGARLELVGNLNFRAFSVGTASVDTNPGGAPNVISGTGSLTINNAHLKGFKAKGGDGLAGGGGGMGAGGAIYLKDGSLTIESCAFEGNNATGGNGSVRDIDALAAGFGPGGGGGGGLGGNGGGTVIFGGGGGGGGARGNGGRGGGGHGAGGGGGGTVFAGGMGGSDDGGPGGVKCGGSGAHTFNNTGHDGFCRGGAGGGGSQIAQDDFIGGGGDGGNGDYGGGGGGAGNGNGARGGHGGFGGGGGSSVGLADFFKRGNGGDGGFGGGGGSGDDTPGHSGAFGGNGSSVELAGGGAGLGGAVFNDSGTVTIRNSTFTRNSVTGGLGGADRFGTGNRGAGAGGAIFSRNNSLIVLNSTISLNTSTDTGGGIVVFDDHAVTSFTLQNAIIANNGIGECSSKGGVTAAGSGNLITSNLGCPGVVSTDDPGLGPLQLNAPGSTPTMAITTASPAFDAGDDNNCLPTDQRGVTRPQFNHCDIGAYEVRPCAITCPADIVVPNDPNQCGAVVNYPAPTTNGGDCGVVTCNPPSGSFFPVGTTTVTCTSAAGSCSFTVTVKDTQPPTISCPASITANTGGPNVGSVVVNYPPAVAGDNCQVVSVQCTPPSGSSFNVGTTTVTCTATDAAGNQGSCSFLVTVFNTVLAAPSGDSIRWNSMTGDYLFIHTGAGAFSLQGKGTASLVNNVRTLTDFRPDRRISASFLMGQLTGRATITVLVAPGVYQTFVIIQSTP